MGTVKHTHHHHELDTPGKDSQLHRAAGASVVGIISPSMNALFLPTEPAVRPKSDAERYQPFMPWLESCDVVLVEGDSQTPAPKLEVWRTGFDSLPLAAEGCRVLGVVTDDPLELDVAILTRRGVAALADWILVCPELDGAAEEMTRPGN